VGELPAFVSGQIVLLPFISAHTLLVGELPAAPAFEAFEIMVTESPEVKPVPVH